MVNDKKLKIKEGLIKAPDPTGSKIFDNEEFESGEGSPNSILKRSNNNFFEVKPARKTVNNMNNLLGQSASDSNFKL